MSLWLLRLSILFSGVLLCLLMLWENRAMLLGGLLVLLLHVFVGPGLGFPPTVASDEIYEQAALASPLVQRHLGGKQPRRVIVIRGRIVNIVC